MNIDRFARNRNDTTSARVGCNFQCVSHPVHYLTESGRLYSKGIREVECPCCTHILSRPRESSQNDPLVRRDFIPHSVHPHRSLGEETQRSRRRQPGVFTAPLSTARQ